jgi:hypothetical protein
MSERSWDEFFAAVALLERLRHQPRSDRLLQEAVRQLERLVERPVVIGDRSHGESW